MKPIILITSSFLRQRRWFLLAYPFLAFAIALMLTVPTGVVSARAPAWIMLWVRWMNSTWNGPRSKGTPGSIFLNSTPSLTPESSNFARARASVKAVP